MYISKKHQCIRVFTDLHLSFDVWVPKAAFWVNV